jgi:MFS family permease
MPTAKTRIVDTYVIAIFLSTLDIEIVTPVLSSIAADFDLTPRWAAWMVAVYLAVFSIALPVMELWPVRQTRERLWMMALFLYAVGSFLVSVSPSWSLLLTGRMLQALGSGGMVPLFAVAIRWWMQKSGPYLRIGLTFLLAGVLVVLPLLSGWTASIFHWRWLFILPIPLVIILFWVAPRSTQGYGRRSQPLDIIGVSFFGLMLFFAMAAMAMMNPDEGWKAVIAPQVLPLWIMALGMVVPLFMVEKQVGAPFFTPMIWQDRRLLLFHVFVFLTGFSWSSVVLIPGWIGFLMPEIGNAEGWSLALIAASASGSVPLSRWVTSRKGCHANFTLGFVLLFIADWLLARILAPWTVGIALVLWGAGLGFTLSAPLHLLLMQWLPSRQVRVGLVAAGMSRAAGGALGLIALAYVLGPVDPDVWYRHIGSLYPHYPRAMELAAGVSAIGFLSTFLLPRKPEERAKSAG